MNKDKYYSIGEVSKITKLSKKTLRYYDEIGLMPPDKVENNQYRFYNMSTLLCVPVIKYYKQMGFKLDEMRSLIEGSTYSNLIKVFDNKLQELKAEEKALFVKYNSVKEWHDLILEAGNVIEHGILDVSLKYLNLGEYTYMNQAFDYNYNKSIVNIEFTNFIEENNNAVLGPVMMYFPSYIDKIKGKSKGVKIFQRTVESQGINNTLSLGGNTVISCYHVGAHENINDTYKKMLEWIDKKGYSCYEYSIERYVTDYWTTKNKDKFVTEIILELQNEI